MKNAKMILALSVLTACDMLPSQQDKGVVEESPTPVAEVKAPEAPPLVAQPEAKKTPVQSSNLVIKDNGTIVATILGPDSRSGDGMLVLMDDKIVRINPWTGAYLPDDMVYFSGTNCVGDAALGPANTVPMKTANRFIMAGDGRFFRVTDVGTGFTAQSYLATSGVCTNSVVSTTSGAFLSRMPANMMPHDLSDLAPLSIEISN